MTTNEILGLFGVVICSNAMTILALYGFAQIAKAEREERETGKKVPIPPFLYLCIILPGLFGALGIYQLS